MQLKVNIQDNLAHYRLSFFTRKNFTGTKTDSLDS